MIDIDKGPPPTPEEARGMVRMLDTLKDIAFLIARLDEKHMRELFDGLNGKIEAAQAEKGTP